MVSSTHTNKASFFSVSTASRPPIPYQAVSNWGGSGTGIPVMSIERPVAPPDCADQNDHVEAGGNAESTVPRQAPPTPQPAMSVVDVSDKKRAPWAETIVGL